MEKSKETLQYEKTLKVGDKVRIIETCKEFSDSSLKGQTGILGKQDILDKRDNFPDIIFLESEDDIYGEAELLENVEVELVPTTMNIIEEFV